MFRWLGFALVVFSLFGLSYQFVNQQLPGWKHSTIELLREAEAAGFDTKAWEQVVTDSKAELPPFYPFSRVRSVLQEASDLVFLASEFQADFSVRFSLEDRTINPDDLQIGSLAQIG